MSQTPSIGRIVHYHSRGSADGYFEPEARAAVVTGVVKVAENPDTYALDLCVLNPTGIFFDQEVEYSEKPAPGHWSWPPRV